jgi:hypothetical protein
VITRVDLATLSKVEYTDERPGPLRSLSLWRTALSNVVESFSRVNLPDATHTFVKALRITRGATIDGSYGLQLSPDRRWLYSAHRGMNEVIVYRYPEMRIARRIPFPPIRRYFPEHLGVLDDTRLGFHHSALSTTSVQR